MIFYTYILFSLKLQKYYIVSTNNLEKRLQRHNHGHTTYTKYGIPWKIVYFEQYKLRSQAYKREMQIKSMKSIEYIKSLINKQS